MGGRMELGLLIGREPSDSMGIEVVVAGQVLPKSHAAHACLGHVDRLQPDA